MDNISNAKDVIIAITAFIGAGLGIYNFIKERKKEKVSLSVIPKAMMSFGLNEYGKEAILASSDRIDAGNLYEYFAIEVVNLSTFAVEIHSVGLLLKGTRERMGIFDPTHKSGDSWPKRIEPRGSVTVHGLLQDVLSSAKVSLVECAYAETVCGHVGKGSSKALERLLELAENR